MKNKTVRTLLAALSVFVCVSMTGCETLGNRNTAVNTAPAVEDARQTLETTNRYFGTSEAGDLTDETVYVLCDANGRQSKVIKSDKITLDGETLYAQNEGREKPPVDVRVTYYFKGRKVEPKDIVGKDGDLTIRFDYENNAEKKVMIDGKEETVKVPFTMMTGLILDHDTFRNVSTTNAKTVDDGSRYIVVGYAFPGLQEGLDLDEDVFKIPDYVEIKADVVNFKMTSSITLASNELLKTEDPEAKEKLDKAESDLNDDLEKIADAVTKLEDGSGALSDGLNTLYEKTGEINDGVNKLTDGSKALSDGAGALDNGAAKLQSGAGALYNGTADLDKGMKELKGGLDTLTANNEALNAGAKTVFETLLSTATVTLQDSGIACPELTIENYDAILEQIIASLDSNNIYENAKNQVTARVDAMGDAIYDAYLAQNAQAVYESYVASQITDEQVTAYAQMLMNAKQETAAEKTAAEATESAEAAVPGFAEIKAAMVQNGVAGLSEEQKAAILAGAKAALTDEQKAAIRQGAIEQGMTSDEVTSGLKKASEGVQKLTGLKAQLDSYKQFYNGLLSYTSGVASVAEGAEKLQAGSEKLNAGAKQLKEGSDSLKGGTASIKGGANELYNGVATLQGNMPALIEGIEKLKDGSNELSDGMKRFDEEGVGKIEEEKEDKIDKLKVRADALREAAKEYDRTSGSGNGQGVK